MTGTSRWPFLDMSSRAGITFLWAKSPAAPKNTNASDWAGDVLINGTPGLPRADWRIAAGIEVSTDRAPVYPAILDELLPVAFHSFEKCANNRVEATTGGTRPG